MGPQITLSKEQTHLKKHWRCLSNNIVSIFLKGQLLPVTTSWKMEVWNLGLAFGWDCIYKWMVEHYHGWWKQTLRSQQVNHPFEWRLTSDRHHVSQEAQTKVPSRNAFIDIIISSSGLDDDLSDHHHLAQPIPSANPFLHTQKDDGQLPWQTKMTTVAPF